MTTTFRTVMAMIMAACFTGAAAAQAQMQQPAQPQQPQMTQSEVMDKLNTLQEQSRLLAEELSEIAQKAVEADPDLLDMHNNLITLYHRKLTEYGHPNEDEIKELQVLQQKLQTAGADDMDEDERRSMTEEFNAKVAEMQTAQQKAQNDPDVQKLNVVFDQARQKAMQEVNPKTTELQKELEDLQRQLQQLQQSLQLLMQQPPH